MPSTQALPSGTQHAIPNSMSNSFLAAILMGFISGHALAEEHTGVEINGTIAAEVVFKDGETDLGLSAADLGMGYTFSETLDAAISLELDDDKIDINEVMLNYHPADNVDVTLGRFVLPFGSFETEMISDPLTREMGRSKQDGISVSAKNDNLTGSVFVFRNRADDSEETISSYGLGVEYETDDLTAGVGYISDAASTNEPGINIYAKTGVGLAKLTAEHILLDEVAGGDHPSATHLEAAFDLADERVLAVTYQRTNAAETLGVAKEATGIAYTMPVADNTTLAAEYMVTTGYDNEKDKVGTVTLGYEFAIPEQEDE